jgi:hypothetical protein
MQPRRGVRSIYGGYDLRDGLEEAERLLEADYLAERKEMS